MNKNFYIVERRKENNMTENANCFLSSSLDKVVDWINNNKDFDKRDPNWYWVVIKIEVDNEFGGELFKIFDWDGNELEEQPIIEGFSEHTEKLNISYLDEVKKQNILDDLKRIESYVSKLHNMIDKSQYLDDETKQNILELKETSHQIYNQEMDKELERQKKDGKEFLSDSDVDDLIDKIKREEFNEK